MSDHERLVGLLRRALALNDELRAENVSLRGLVHQLTDEQQLLREQFAKCQDDRAAEASAADVMLGAAMDELLARRNQKASS